MNHPASETLSDFLDGALPPAEQHLVEGHLASCAECAREVQEFRRVLAQARALTDRPPASDLWPGVAAAIGAAPSGRRRMTFSLPQLLAAGIALMLFSGGSVALLLRTARGTSRVTPPVMSASPVLTAGAGLEDRGYDAAVRELEAAVVAGRSRLDSTTVRVVTEKLALIDRAIAEAERAVASDPASNYLNGHLAETRLRKLQLLRRTAALTRAVS